MTHEILLVEDSTAQAAVYRSYLEAEGHHVHAVDSGEACLDRLTRAAYDVILLDIWLPGIDGIAALQRLNRGPTRVLTEIPVRALYLVLQLFFELMDRVFFDPREVLAHVVVARKRG